MHPALVALFTRNLPPEHGIHAHIKACTKDFRNNPSGEAGYDPFRGMASILAGRPVIFDRRAVWMSFQPCGSKINGRINSCFMNHPEALSRGRSYCCRNIFLLCVRHDCGVGISVSLAFPVAFRARLGSRRALLTDCRAARR